MHEQCPVCKESLDKKESEGSKATPVVAYFLESLPENYDRVQLAALSESSRPIPASCIKRD